MSRLLPWLDDAIAGVSHALGGAGNAIGNAVQGAEHAVGINRPQAPQAPQQNAPQVAQNINQATGFNAPPPPPQFAPPKLGLPTPTKAPDTIDLINKQIGGSPLAKAQAAQINPNDKQVNPLGIPLQTAKDVYNAGNDINHGVSKGIINTAIGLPMAAYQSVAGTAKGINQGLPGFGDIAQNQNAANQQMAAVDAADKVAQDDYHSGKISQGRLAQLLYSNSVDRSNASANLQNQASQYRTPGQFGSDLVNTGALALSGGLKGTGPASNIIRAGLGVGFGGQALSQLPEIVKQYNDAKTLEEKAAIATQGAAMTGLGIAGVAGGIHEGLPVVKAGIGRVAQDVNNPSGLLRDQSGKAPLDPSQAGKIPQQQIDTVHGLVRDSGLSPEEFKAKVVSSKQALLSQELQNMQQELDAGGITQGSLHRDENGTVIGRSGRQSTNPDWYKQLYSEGFSKPRVASAIRSGNTDTAIGKRLQEISDQRLSGRYTDSTYGPIPANNGYVGANHALNVLDKHPIEAPSPTPTQAGKNVGGEPNKNTYIPKPGTEKPASTVTQAQVDKFEKSLMNRVNAGHEEAPVEDLAAQRKAAAIAAPTENKVDLTPGTGGVKSAIANSQSVHNELVGRADRTIKIARRLSEEDRQIANRYEYGENIKDLLVDAKDPVKLEKALNGLRDYYDYKLAAERAAGAPVPKVNNYGRHFYDLSRPGEEDRLNSLASQQGISTFQGTSSQPRVFPTYKEAEDLGFKRLHKDIFEDMRHDANISSKRVSDAALKEGLLRTGGEEVSSKGAGVDKNGKQFVNSNIPGLNGLSYSERIAKELKGYNQLDRNQFGKTYDKLNYIQKTAVLSLSLFHSMNISLNFAGATAFSHPFIMGKGLGNSAIAFISPKYFAHMEKGFRERGVLDYEAKNGIVAGGNHDLDPEGLQAKIGASRLNPIAQGHNAIFQREIPIMTHYLSELAMKKGVTAGSKEGIALGQEINNVMGLMNQKIMGRDPNVQKWANRFMLAPAFTETKFRTLGDALTKWGSYSEGGVKGAVTGNEAGNLARKAVLGKTALEGIIGLTGGIIATGQFPTLQAMLGQAVDPYIPTGIQNNAQDKDGNHGTKGAFLPHSFISEVTDPVSKALHGDPSGIVHYANARLSPNLSAITKLATNQDYFGNPIIDQSKPVAGQLAGNAIKQILPIGVQNALDLASGKKGVAETALNEAGLRVKNDPNNPINQASSAHYAAIAKEHNSLGKNDQAAFDTINPQTKNPDGTYTQAANFDPYKKADQTYTLLSHPAVLDAMIKLNQAQPNHDPMWDLPKEGDPGQPSLKTFLVHQGIQATDHGIETAKVLANENPWITDVTKSRSDFFKTLPLSQNPDAANPIKYPAPDANTQALMDQVSKMTDPAQKSAFYKAHPEISDAFDKLSQYTNDIRGQEGVPLFNNNPKASPSVQTALDAKNYKDPAVQRYLNQVAAYNVAKGGAMGQFQGSPLSSSTLKAVQNLSNYGIVKNPDGSLAVAGSPQAMGGAIAMGKSGYSKRYGSGGKMTASKRRQIKFAVKNIAKDSSRTRYAVKGSKLGLPKVTKGTQIPRMAHTPKNNFRV